MLVLSRKKNESIVIDDKITIIIVDIRGDKVRLGIDAPKDVTVHRQEVFEAIRQDSEPEEIPEVSAKKARRGRSKSAGTRKPSARKEPTEAPSTEFITE